MTTEQINELTAQKASELIMTYRMGKFVNAEEAILEGMKVGIELARMGFSDIINDEQFMNDQMVNASNIN